MNEKNIKRCCFTGHRPEKLILSEASIPVIENKIKALLRPVIRDMLSRDKTIFITGMSRGFDLWAADIVLQEKILNPEIKLVCALPFSGFEQRWAKKDRLHYHNILENADFIKELSPHYYAGCFQKRNIFMVDSSSAVIAAFNGSPGGTKNTIRYAEKNGTEIINILPCL